MQIVDVSINERNTESRAEEGYPEVQSANTQNVMGASHKSEFE